MQFHFDRYTLNARLAPMLITLMPIGLAIISLFPASSSSMGLIIGAVSYCGLLVLLSNLGRDLGQKKEKSLFKKWGGIPTTTMLDPVKSDMTPEQLEAIHSRLEKLTAIPRPESDENKDAVYEAWTTYLRTNTRGQDNGQFRLVLTESINYGFRRNLYGLRWIGFWMAIISLGIILGEHSVIALADPDPWCEDLLDMRPAAKAATLITTCTALVFLCVVREKWVKMAATDYAKHLLESTFILDKKEETQEKP